MSSKTFTHLWLDDKGLKAFNAPDKRFYDNLAKEIGTIESDVAHKFRFQQALAEGVYFKDSHLPVTVRMFPDGTIIEKNKPYPVPDGYEVRVEQNSNHKTFETITFAILVPKEKGLPSWVTDDSGPEKESKQQSIEEAADNYVIGKLYKSVRKESYIAGAKSDAAREYWYEQFKREQQ